MELLLVALSVVAPGADSGPSDRELALFKMALKERDDAVARIDKEMSELRSKRAAAAKDRKLKGRERTERLKQFDGQIRAKEEERSERLDSQDFVLPDLDGNLRRGAAGYFRWKPIVLSVPSRGNLLVNWSGQRLWIEGINTREIVDGDQMTFNPPFEVVDPMEYQNLDGAVRRVTKLRVLSVKDLEPKYREWLTNQPGD